MIIFCALIFISAFINCCHRCLSAVAKGEERRRARGYYNKTPSFSSPTPSQYSPQAERIPLSRTSRPNPDSNAQKSSNHGSQPRYHYQSTGATPGSGQSSRKPQPATPPPPQKPAPTPKTVDLYSILEFPSSRPRNSITLEHIKKAYKNLAMRYHPDKQDRECYETTERFKQVSLAYEVLSDERRRQVFDLTGNIDQ